MSVFTSRAMRYLNEEDGVEDGVYIDVDGDMAIDVDHNEDAFDGNEANAEEIQQAIDAEFDFDGQADAVTEAYNAIYEANYNWSQMMQTLGMFELNEAVHGRVAVLQEADIKGFISKAREMIARLVQKVASICATAITKIVTKNKMFMKWIKGKNGSNVTRMKSGVTKLKSDKDKFKNFKGYPYSGLDKGGEALKKALDNQSFCSIDKSAKWYKRVTVSMKSGSKDEMRSIANDYRKEFFPSGSSDVTAENFRTELGKYYRGSDTKIDLTDLIKRLPDNIDKAFIDRAGSRKAKDTIAGSYKAFESNANKALAKLKAMQAKTFFTQSNDQNASMESITATISLYKELKSIGSVAIATFINASMGELAQNINIARKLTSMGDKPTKESASLFGSSYGSSSLFDSLSF